MSDTVVTVNATIEMLPHSLSLIGQVRPSRLVIDYMGETNWQERKHPESPRRIFQNNSLMGDDYLDWGQIEIFCCMPLMQAFFSTPPAKKTKTQGQNSSKKLKKNLKLWEDSPSHMQNSRKKLNFMNFSSFLGFCISERKSSQMLSYLLKFCPWVLVFLAG